MKRMNETRISSLRQELGWTQERLAAESQVGLRTIQRLEAGHDASLETLSLVSAAVKVPVRDLFVVLDGQGFNDRVEAMELRTELQQSERDRIMQTWKWGYFLVGLVVTVIALLSGQWGAPILLTYWVVLNLVLRQLRAHVLEPRLDVAFPLSRSTLKPTVRRARRESQSVAGAGQ